MLGIECATYADVAQEPSVDWLAWLPHAQEIIHAWQAANNCQTLPGEVHRDLAQRIARELDHAYAMGVLSR